MCPLNVKLKGEYFVKAREDFFCVFRLILRELGEFRENSKKLCKLETRLRVRIFYSTSINRIL